MVLIVQLTSSLWNSETKLVHPKGNPPWIFIGRTGAEAEAPILWPPDAKSQLTGKDPDAGKDWRQREKRATEDEMARQPHWFNGHELEQTLGDSGGQGSPVCRSPCVTNSRAWLSNWTAAIVKLMGSLQNSEEFVFMVNLLAQIPSIRLPSIRLPSIRNRSGLSYPPFFFNVSKCFCFYNK